jgi:hypothetical protein
MRGRASKTGYQRDLYGRGWPTVAGCDIRNRILSRDLVNVRPSSRDAQLRGRVRHTARSHTGATLSFQRGNTTSSLVQIDHRYPLALSHQQDVQQWSQAQRERFAADPARLNSAALVILLIGFFRRYRMTDSWEAAPVVPLLLSIIGLAVVGVSGFLGGKLAYHYGVRVADESVQAEGFGERRSRTR